MGLVILSTFGPGPFEYKTGDNSPNKRRAALLFHAGVSTHCRMARHRPVEGISDILDFEIRPPRLLIRAVDRDLTFRIDFDQEISFPRRIYSQFSLSRSVEHVIYTARGENSFTFRRRGAVIKD